MQQQMQPKAAAADAAADAADAAADHLNKDT